MTIVLDRPGVDGLREAVGALRELQYDGAPMQLHPGDLGWFWRFGAKATAAAVRTWSRDGQILAVGLLDGPKLLRLTMAPDARRNEELTQQLVADLARPKRDVLTVGQVYVEAPAGALVQDLLSEHSWNTDEPWTPLRRDFTEPVKGPDALQDLGSSSAIVCTPSSNVGAVATCKSAGFQPLPEVRDRRREALLPGDGSRSDWSR